MPIGVVSGGANHSWSEDGVPSFPSSSTGRSIETIALTSVSLLIREHGCSCCLSPLPVTEMVGSGTPPIRFRPLREGSASGTYTRRSTQAKSEETVIAFPEAWSAREITIVYVPLLPPGSTNGLTLPGSGAMSTSDRAPSTPMDALASFVL